MGLSTGSRWFLGLLVLSALLVGGGLWYVNDQLAGVPGPSEPVEITVEEGATAAEIGAQLERRDVVKNGLAFRLVARSQNLDAGLRAGRYTLETGMAVSAAVEALREDPEPLTIRVTVREGLSVPLTLEALAEQTPHTVEDYRQVLDRHLQGDAATSELELPDWLPAPGGLGPQVRHPFEGMLFPETYQFEPDAPPEAILQRMLDQLDREMQDALAELTGQRRRDVDRYRAMIIASLIERESRVVEERPKVSAVIRNRLAEDMRLQIDATVLYALGRHTERVLTENTRVDSPYNTYQNRGLPPSPIAGFSGSSLQAALQPADTDARYYVLSPECDGTHEFARTLQQHNANKAAYEQAGRCQGDGS